MSLSILTLNHVNSRFDWSRTSRARRAREPASRRSTKSLNCTRRDRLSIIVSSGVNKSFVSSQTCIVYLHGLFFVICVTFVKLRTAWVLMCHQPALAAGLAVNLGRSSHVRARALDRSTRARGDWTAFETETSLSRAATPPPPRRRHGQRNHRVAHSPGPLPARGELAPHLQDVAGQRRASSHPAIRSRRVDSSAIVPCLARDAASDPARLPDPRPRASLLVRSCRDSSATADA